MPVINNSQIYASVLRVASVVSFLAAVLELVLREISPGNLKEIGKAFALFVLEYLEPRFADARYVERASPQRGKASLSEFGNGPVGQRG